LIGLCSSEKLQEVHVARAQQLQTDEDGNTVDGHRSQDDHNDGSSDQTPVCEQTAV
jgi:hypothetical protein